MSKAARKQALDLTNHDFRRESRELTVFGTWLWLADEDEDEPCLAIVKTNAIGTPQLVPCVVLLSEAWRYDQPRSGHIHLLKVAYRFVKALGLADNMTSAHMVADAIHSHLLDLIKIPPKQYEQNRSSGAEAIITAPDGRKLTTEMFDEK